MCNLNLGSWISWISWISWMFRSDARDGGETQKRATRGRALRDEFWGTSCGCAARRGQEITRHAMIICDQRPPGGHKEALSVQLPFHCFFFTFFLKHIFAKLKPYCIIFHLSSGFLPSQSIDFSWTDFFLPLSARRRRKWTFTNRSLALTRRSEAKLASKSHSLVVFPSAWWRQHWAGQKIKYGLFTNISDPLKNHFISPSKMLQVEKVHFSSGTVRLALWHPLASLGISWPSRISRISGISRFKGKDLPAPFARWRP